MINIVLDPANLWQCFSRATVLPGFAPGVAAAELALRAITITPPLTQESDFREIEWRLGLPLLASDAGKIDEVLTVLGKLLDAAVFFAGAAATAGVGVAASPLVPTTLDNAQSAIDRARQLVRDIEAAVKAGVAEADFDFVGLHVVFAPSRA